MKVLSIYRLDPARMQEPPSEDTYAKMGALIGEAMQAGALVDTGGIIPTGIASRVRLNGNGSLSVTDGPFTETKEIVGGYAVFDVASKEELLKWTERFLSIAGPGMCELIEVTGPEE